MQRWRHFPYAPWVGWKMRSRRTPLLSKVSLRLPEPSRLRPRPHAFIAIFRRVFSVGVQRAGGGGGQEPHGRWQAAVMLLLRGATDSTQCRAGLPPHPPARGNAGKHKTMEEEQTPELPEPSPCPKGRICPEPPAGCSSSFAGGERCGSWRQRLLGRRSREREFQSQQLSGSAGWTRG